MKTLVFLCALMLVLNSCASQPQAPDTKADTELGESGEEEKSDTQQALTSMQQSQQEEQGRRIQRQVTDPLDRP